MTGGAVVTHRTHAATTRPAPATTPFPRDLAATALVLAVAAFVWFGWSAAAAPVWWPAVSAPGSLLAAAAAVLAGHRLRRLRGTGTALAEPGAGARYGRWVATEVAVAGLGCLALAVAGAVGFVAPWVLAVVGTHFLPLADLFRVRALRRCGVVLVGVAAAAAGADVLGLAAASTVAGGAGAAVLLGTAVHCLRARDGRR